MRTPNSRNAIGYRAYASAASLQDRIREFAAGQEAGLLAVDRQHVRLGEDLEEAASLQGLDGGAEIEIGPEQEEVESVGKRTSRGCPGLSETTGGVNWPVATRPMVLVAPVLIRFRPSSVVLLRSTEANWTLSRICVSGGRDVYVKQIDDLADGTWQSRVARSDADQVFGRAGQKDRYRFRN